MPVHESEAIILQSYALGEADRLVSFLSRNSGRLRGVAKGARRTKSRFGSTLERLSHIRIWYFERENRELVNINQCELLESFVDASRDYDVSVALGLLAEISGLVLPEREAADAPFRLLLLVSRAIKQSGQSAVPLSYFCLWTLKLAGWLPSLDACAHCGKKLGDAAPKVSPALPGFLCSRCRIAGAHATTKEVADLARQFLSSKLDELVREKFSPLAVRELTSYSLDWIELQAEKKLISRKLWEPQT